MKRTITALIGLSALLEANAFNVIAMAQYASCGLSNGSVTTTVWSNVGDICDGLTYLWSNGSTDADLFNVPAGEYWVTVTDDCGNNGGDIAYVYDMFILGEWVADMVQPDCQGQCNGIAVFDEPQFSGGTAPFDYSVPVVPYGPGQLAATGLCSGQSSVFTVTDANGCPGTFYLQGLLSAEPSVVTVTNSTPACEGESNGTLSVLLDGTYASQLQVSRVGGGYDQLHFPALQVPYTITDLAAGEYQLISQIPADSGGVACTMSYNGIVAEQPSPCGSVSGRVFNDADQDCIDDAGEFGLLYRVLTIEPGPTYAITNGQGVYYAATGYGSFTLAQPLVDETQLCPGTAPVPFTIDTGTPHVTLDLADSSWAPMDLSVSIWSSPARSGFPVWAIANVMNNSAYPTGDITVTITYDPVLGTLTTVPAPGGSSSGTLTWELPALGPYGHYQFHLSGHVPANFSLVGTVINYTVNAESASLELNTTNNTMVLPVTITSSCDPNDKIGRTSSGFSATSYFLDEDAFIDYTIRFQNTGTDTAFTVVVRDQLEADLDPATLEILGTSHAYWPSFENDRELVFTFANINLPDSGTNETASHGSIHFRIRPSAGIVVGDVISNSAGIYFDFNPPVITNTSELMVEMSTAMENGASPPMALIAAPNPASGKVRLIVPQGMSIQSVTVIAPDGRIVLRADGPGAGRELDVSELPAGCYVIRARGAAIDLRTTLLRSDRP
jgi:hypothetical protein